MQRSGIGPGNETSSPPEPKARGCGDAAMDRDGFIEFVQWIFVGGDTQSKCRDHGLLTLECDCAICERGLYKPAN